MDFERPMNVEAEDKDCRRRSLPFYRCCAEATWNISSHAKSAALTTQAGIMVEGMHTAGSLVQREQCDLPLYVGSRASWWSWRCTPSKVTGLLLASSSLPLTPSSTGFCLKLFGNDCTYDM